MRFKKSFDHATDMSFLIEDEYKAKLKNIRKDKNSIVIQFLMIVFEDLNLLRMGRGGTGWKQNPPTPFSPVTSTKV